MPSENETETVASGELRHRHVVPGSDPKRSSDSTGKTATGAATSGKRHSSLSASPSPTSVFDLPPAPPLRRRPLTKVIKGYLTFAIISLFSAYFFVVVGFPILSKVYKKRREGGERGGAGTTTKTKTKIGTAAGRRSRAEAIASEPGIEGIDVVHEFIDVPVLPDEDDNNNENSSTSSNSGSGRRRTTSIHIARAGVDPARRVVLFLHGFPECWLSWRPLMKRLVERGYEVAAMDMRGYNLSGRPGVDETTTSSPPLLPPSTSVLKNYDLGALAADARAVAVHLSGPSKRKVTLASHDWGGAVAWATASIDSAAARGEFGGDKRPNERLFDALITCAIPHTLCFQQNMNWEQAKRSWYIACFQSPLVPEIMMGGDGAAPIRAMLPRRTEEEKKEADEIADAFTVPGAPTATINYYRASVRAIAVGPLSPSDARAKKSLRGGVDVPVLVLYAKHDSALGPELVAGTERFSNAGVEVHLLESGHWIQLEKKDEVAEKTLAFLERTGGNMARFV